MTVAAIGSIAVILLLYVGACLLIVSISIYSSSVHSLLPKDNLFKNIFVFSTASDWDCVAAVERLPALHYTVDFIFLSFEIMGFIVDL